MYLILLLSIFFSLFTSSPKVIYHGDTSLKYIYLTFDDGYSNKNTIKILDTLRKYDVPAVFFIHGEFLKYNPDTVKRIAIEQTLGNHTMCHKDIRKLSNDAFIKDIKEFEALAYQITNVKPSKLFRPPMGFINEEKTTILTDNGYKIFKWNCSIYDYNINNDYGEEYVITNILKNTHNGSIILMHTMTKSNVNSLPTIIVELRKRGFIFKSLIDYK